jgi:hypothetical protein
MWEFGKCRWWLAKLLIFSKRRRAANRGAPGPDVVYRKLYELGTMQYPIISGWGSNLVTCMPNDSSLFVDLLWAPNFTAITTPSLDVDEAELMPNVGCLQVDYLQPGKSGFIAGQVYQGGGDTHPELWTINPDTRPVMTP